MSKPNIYFIRKMKPNRFKTLRERIEVAKKFDNLHKRPTTEDYQWWDDCDRNESKPSEDEMNPNT